MKKFLKVVLLLVLLIATWAVSVYHVGVYPMPAIPPSDAPATAKWIDKKEIGIHQLIVSGSPYERGREGGKLTSHLLYLQEKTLTSKLDSLLKNRGILQVFILATIRWFWGIDRFLEDRWVQEMAGVSEATSHEFDYLADRMTRQVAYHGLHEVGQMMVDQTGDDMGCTVLAVPHEKGWMIGRNFDFEGGRVFDSEKIMKWVYPEEGHAFVSVIWAGMVGVVTGVNDQGVYVSINAAGSRDFARHGTPSTLVLLKALQFSNTAREAIEIIRKEQMFITDIFVVSDRVTGEAYLVEKSPKATEVIPQTQAFVVTNHLVSDRWANDQTNVFRREELTSHFRMKRGQELLASLQGKKLDSRKLETTLLGFLRDKGWENGAALHAGNRRAIDSLIAAHSVIYNEPENVLFVSQGPALSGKFIGFDLAKSFADRSPHVVRTLARDPEISDERFDQVRLAAQEDSRAGALARKGKCDKAEKHLRIAEANFSKSYTYYSAQGDLLNCRGERAAARVAWQTALDLHPAYPHEVTDLERKMKGE